MAVKQGLVGFNAADIFLPTLVATGCGLLSALVAVALVQRIPLWRAGLLGPLAGFAAIVGALVWALSRLPADQAAQWMGLIGAGFIMAIVAVFLVAGAVRRVNVYEAFVDGAK